MTDQRARRTVPALFGLVTVHESGGRILRLAWSGDANSTLILIPCDRVFGAATLGGFCVPGGIETTVAVLRHENSGALPI